MHEWTCLYVCILCPPISFICLFIFIIAAHCSATRTISLTYSTYNKLCIYQSNFDLSISCYVNFPFTFSYKILYGLTYNNTIFIKFSFITSWPYRLMKWISLPFILHPHFHNTLTRPRSYIPYLILFHHTVISLIHRACRLYTCSRPSQGKCLIERLFLYFFVSFNIIAILWCFVIIKLSLIYRWFFLLFIHDCL